MRIGSGTPAWQFSWYFIVFGYTVDEIVARFVVTFDFENRSDFAKQIWLLRHGEGLDAGQGDGGDLPVGHHLHPLPAPAGPFNPHSKRAD